ncbi:MAG: hypothetical protein Ct9H300mP1_09860 [Planctomycetaceae bacterium]|nr:MAG: hypothetical protein Ct9H300mP1_09860 [Planctomycetaceae bacterium]
MLEGHPAWVSRLVFTPDGSRLISSDLHGTLIGWDLTADPPKPAWTVKDAHPSKPGDPGWIRALAVTGDGKTLLTAGTDGIIRRWSIADGKPAGTLEAHAGDIFSLAMHPDGKTLVSGDIFGVVHQWDLSAGKSVRQFDAAQLHSRKENFLADVGGVRSLAFDKPGKRLACGGMTDAMSNSFCPGHPGVLVFDFASGKQTQLLRMKKGKVDDGPITGLAFLEDGTVVGQGERLQRCARSSSGIPTTARSCTPSTPPRVTIWTSIPTADGSARRSGSPTDGPETDVTPSLKSTSLTSGTCGSTS